MERAFQGEGKKQEEDREVLASVGVGLLPPCYPLPAEVDTRQGSKGRNGQVLETLEPQARTKQQGFESLEAPRVRSGLQKPMPAGVGERLDTGVSGCQLAAEGTTPRVSEQGCALFPLLNDVV